MHLDTFVKQNDAKIRGIAERLKDYKVKGFPLRYENAKKSIITWLQNFENAGFQNLSLPLSLLESIEFLKTETLTQKIAELLEPFTNNPNTYLAPLGESSESSHRIVSNFNQYENYFPNITALLNNIPDSVSATIVLIDDFLNSGGQLINIFYALLNKPLPDGEPNDEIDFRTHLNSLQVQRLRSAKIVLIYYLAFDEGIQKIISHCNQELQLSIEVKRFLPTNKNASAFGDPHEQEAIREGLRAMINSSTSAFTGRKTEDLTKFYKLLIEVGYKLNSYNKPHWTDEKKKERSLGYSNLGRLIVTDYNIPTITITALWQSGELELGNKKVQWNSLVPRREKKLSNGLPQEELGQNSLTFLKEIKELEDLAEKQDVKGHSDIQKILRLYRPNSRFIEIGNNINKAKKIGYRIFTEFEIVHKKASHYIYLYRGISLSQTFEEIKHRHPDIIKAEKSLIVILPKETHHVLTNRRIDSTKQLFNPLNIFYLDEFIRLCTPSDYFENNDIRFLENPSFITPTIKSEFYNEGNLETIKTWLASENEPILAIKGVGGVGKTTLAEYISDLFLKKEKHAKVIFIDSHEIIEELIRRQRFNETIDLYHLYAVDSELSTNDTYVLTKDQLRFNLDAGNILIVIDGLDEVISRIPKFDVESFLDSIFKYTDETGNGKILICCRSYFWQSSKYSSNQITSIEVLPFDINQAKKFLEKCFPDNNYKVRKALEFADRLQISDGENEPFYHPYVLDIIRDLIETERDIQENDISIESLLLKKSVKYDHIIYHMCFRESNRILKGLTIDEQVKIFIEIAVDYKGSIKLKKFNDFVNSILGRHIDSSLLEGFKSHPFMLVNDDNIHFRYDFFNQYMKSIYVYSYINQDSEYKTVDRDFINILVEDCWYNSGTINDLKTRIQAWEDDDYLKLIDLLYQIKSNSDLESDVSRKSISHLFFVALAIQHISKSNDINSNTELLKLLFEKNGCITKFSVINFNSKKDNIRFDFRGLRFSDCYIDNFESFWLCPTDGETVFKNCTLINLNFRELLKSPIPRSNFIECTFNEEIDDVYRQKRILQGSSLNLQIRYFLEDFLKLFISKSKIETHSYNEIVPRFFKDNTFPISEVDLISLLQKKGVIKIYFESGIRIIKLAEAYRSDVKDFVRNGIMKSSLSSLIKEIKVLVKTRI